MDWIAPLLRQLADLGIWGPVLFILLYVVAAITLAPAFLLTFSAGAVFGLWRGTLLTFVGASLGASAVFAVAAPLARSRVLRWIDRDPRVASTRRAVVRDSAWIMFLLRLSPLVPYNLLNYALALSGVRFRDYLVALVGMFPAITMYAYYGKVAGDVTRIAAGVSPPRGTEYYAMMVIGLIATFAATHLIGRAAKKAMAEEGGVT
ncbi:MAG TPA: TVP38/TMEM64 family protein [Vicinamibacterales bacterium]|nr:TVP38/TMEM64 family protein [Vicinamibacterales bacterium]